MTKKPTAPPPRQIFAPEPLAVRIRRWRPTVMQSALAISIAAHALLLGLRLVNPQAFNRVFQDTPLEVILVNARSREAPTKAQAIAQAQLAGGGEADSGRATSPLPPSPTVSTGDSELTTHQRMERLQREQEQLLTQTRRALALMPAPDPKKANLTPQEREEIERRQQMLRQFAEIEKAVSQQNAKPRRRYLSPATREEVYAVYYDGVRHRIEDRGTRDYPTVNGRKLFGALMANITVDARGQVLNVEIMQTSGSRALDMRAVEIVRHAGPFGAFTEEMRKQADEIEFTWRFSFTGAAGLVATPLGNGRLAK